MFLPKTFSGGGYQVTVNKDRSILVKQGDWLSKYAMAIWRDYSKPYIDKFCYGHKDPNGKFVPRTITNKDLIKVGETVYHPDPLPGEPASEVGPKDPKPGTGKICRRAALLTCITNGAGRGPGHSAIVVDDHVFTFEIAVGGRPASSTSDWLVYKTQDYLKLNTWRPVVLMELRAGMTNATAIYQYITRSEARFGRDGLCSHLAAEAISDGLGWNINPSGLNTPYKVATLVKNSGAVSSSYFTFPDAGDGSNLTDSQLLAVRRLMYEFPYEWNHRMEPPGVLKWT
ncbi:MAG TPA: hypothetical protein VJ890_09855 [Vineibacter sp.]|nr:hypothetical protein [Vineibacter sp.]